MASCATSEDEQKLLDAIATLGIEESAAKAEEAIAAVDPSAPDEEVEAKAAVAEAKEAELAEKVQEMAKITSKPLDEAKAAVKSFLQAKDRERIMNLMKGAQTVSLMFVLDATGSMWRIRDAVKATVREIIGELQTSLKYLKFEIGAVAYRDVCDEGGIGRFAIHNFAGSISGFEKFLADLEVAGGGDAAEDVIGGLAKALEMPWKWHNKVLILCGDAPCHGSQYYESKWVEQYGASWDEHPDGVFKDSQPVKPILEALRAKGVQITFLRINDSTDKMISEFNKEAGEGVYIASTDGLISIGSTHTPGASDVTPAEAIAEVVKKSVKDSVTGSVSRSEATATAAGMKGTRDCSRAMMSLMEPIGEEAEAAAPAEVS